MRPGGDPSLVGMSGTDGLLGAVYDSVAERSPLLEAGVERLTVGDRLVLVEVEGSGQRAAGVAHRPPGDLEVDPSGERAVDVQITRLRRKIEDDPRDPIWIQTVRGEGYRLVAEPEFETVQ